ncbi:hypothetical protein ES705_35895 [subsurface metagenome]
MAFPKWYSVISIVLVALACASVEVEEEKEGESYSDRHEKPTIALINSGSVGISEEEADMIMVSFFDYLSKLNEFEVVDARRAERILSAQELSLAECSSPECVRNIGKLLAVDYILAVRSEKIGEQIFASTKFFRIEDGLTLGVFSRSYPEVYQLTNSISDIIQSLFYREALGEEAYEEAWAGILVTCREYLLRDVREDEEYGLYSYMLFAKEPDDEGVERYRAFYRAFLKLKEYGEYKSLSVKKKNANVVYWLLDVDSWSEVPAEELEDFDFFIKHYDYARADLMLRTKLPKFTNPGPLIVACQTPLSNPTAVLTDSELLIVDLSRISENLFDATVSYFRNKVIEDPETWQIETHTE